MMNFDNAFSKHIKEQIESWFSGGRRPHAVLIDGGTPEERENTARFLSEIFVCSDSGNKPCGVCNACRKVKEGIHPDIQSVTPPPDKKFFVKSALKQVVEDAYILPNESEVKVFILKEMQFMTVESQNVLLKILEEPPEYTAFILTSDNAADCIGTVRSRVTRLHLSGEDDAIKPSEKAIAVMKNLSSALIMGTAFDLLEASAPLDGDKELIAEVLSLSELFFRDVLAAANGSAALVTELAAESKSLSERLPRERVFTLYDRLSALRREAAQYPNYTLLATLIPVRLQAE